MKQKASVKDLYKCIVTAYRFLVNDSLCYEVLPFIFGPCIDSTVQMGSAKPGQEARKGVVPHLETVL